MLTQHWFSGTRATVSSYRMQREIDVCESVCEAGVLVHGSRRCRACHLCVCAQCVCVCHLWRHHAQTSARLTPLARGQCCGGHRYQVLQKPRARTRAHSLCLPVSLFRSLSLFLVESVGFMTSTERTWKGK